MNIRRNRLSVILGLMISLWIGCIAPSFAAPVPDASAPEEIVSAESTISPIVVGNTGAETALGAEIFEVHCAGCHVNGGNIIRRGKNLKMKALRRNHMDSVETIAHLVTVGKRPMSAYADTLSPQEIEAVSKYVLERAQQGWK
ncbi:MAG: c-type cytochrome [Cyanobacteria bacterium J06626_14]